MTRAAADRPANLDYARDGRTRRRAARWILLAALLVAASLAWGYRRPVIDRLAFLYWQRQCMRYTADPSTRLWIEGAPAVAAAALPRADSQYVTLPGFDGDLAFAAFRPRCLRRLTAGLPRFLDDWTPVVFLHERVSPHGTRRLVVVRFGPNVDHAQLCTMMACTVTPATLARHATVRSQPYVEWFPGFWTGRVRKDRLHFAQADPADASHFVFRYETAAARQNPLNDAEPQNDDRTFIVDGWLRDDATIDLRLRQPTPSGDGP